VSVKVYMTGAANNTPVVLSEDEAKQFWKYIEYEQRNPFRTIAPTASPRR
jgi:hypothetical protein